MALVCVNAYVEQIGPSPSTCPGHPDHCYDEITEEHYKPREEFYQRKNRCEKIWCHADFSMDVHG